MAIDIFSIEPSVVSKDLSEKSFLIYGDKKSGKTSNAVKFPKPLLIGFEKGWNAISGVKAQPISSWSDYKTIIKQLKNPNAKNVYKTIIMDTADIAYDLCEKYICGLEGVAHLDDTPNKRGYKLVEKEFESTIIEIIKLGFTFVAISHSETTQMKDEKGEKYEKIIPTVNKRGLKVIARTVDIIGYSKSKSLEDGSKKTYLLLRGSQYYEAGSRWKYTPEYIEFTYDNLVNAIVEAIVKQEQEEGENTIVDHKDSIFMESESVNFDELYDEAISLCNKIIEKNNENSSEIIKIAEKYLGKGKKISQCTEEQIEQLVLITDDLRDLYLNK
jgi:hypothetical protein